MQKYCYNCMYPLDGASFCGHCGADCKTAPACATYHLPCGTALGGDYIVGRVLGEGGFGITYIGLQKTLSKRVAIKEFYPSGIAQRDNSVSNNVEVPKERRDFFQKGVDRFLFEAKSVAAFNDEEGIVDVQQYFHENNTAYIVMEFLDGENLKQYISRHGLFDADELISLLIPVMKALKNMHAKGLIHRDISPDNIMYTKRGKLKLMDFGSARSYLDDEEQIAIILKQGFAPEEQFRHDGEQGPYTDVYALCATIYTCITGKVPPVSQERVKNDELVPPSKRGVSISAAHEQALMHGLAVFAKDRTPDMSALIAEFTAKTPVDIETATTKTYPVKKKTAEAKPVGGSEKAAQPDKHGKTEKRDAADEHKPLPSPKKQEPPASPNEYMNARKTPDSTVMPNEQPTPPKPAWRTVLSIAIPIVIMLGAVIAGCILIASRGGDQKATSSSSGSSQAQSSLNIKELLSGIDSTRPTFYDPNDTQPTTAATQPTVPAPLSLSEAQEYKDSLKSFFLNNVEHNDPEARYGERIELYSIYYSESVRDPRTKYIAFVYRNGSANYYKVLYAPASQFSVNNGKLDYSTTFLNGTNSDPTLSGATENCWFLSLPFTKQYDNTKIF